MVNKNKNYVLKRRLWGEKFKIKMKDGSVITGILASPEQESRIAKVSHLPFNINNYLTLIREEKNRPVASFISSEEIETIEHYDEF